MSIDYLTLLFYNSLERCDKLFFIRKVMDNRAIRYV